MSKEKIKKEQIFNILDENINKFENMERKEILHLLSKKVNASESSFSKYYLDWKKGYMLPKDSMKVEFEIQKDIILKGKYAEFILNENGITVDDLNFKSLEEIIEYENKELAEFNMRMAELKAAARYLNQI